MAWLGMNYFYMDTQDHAIYHVWIQLFHTSYARGEKPFGLELESNPSPLASQATALTTRPLDHATSGISVGNVKTRR